MESQSAASSTQLPQKRLDLPVSQGEMVQWSFYVLILTASSAPTPQPQRLQPRPAATKSGNLLFSHIHSSVHLASLHPLDSHYTHTHTHTHTKPILSPLIHTHSNCLSSSLAPSSLSSLYSVISNTATVKKFRQSVNFMSSKSCAV